MLYEDTVILLYAKAPVAGKVNTRLIPDIGIQAATELQHDLIHQRLSMLNRADLAAVFLMCAPATSDQCFVQCGQQYPITLLAQAGSDLGERMFNGIKKALDSYKFCIVIGTDAPALDAEVISQAIEKLHAGELVVFVPAEDGGYVLLGLQYPYEFLFQNIDWGSDRVMQQSRHQLERHNVAHEELDTCWDIDRLDDYQRYLTLKNKLAK